MGLKPGHGGSAVVQHHQGDIGLVVDRIDHRRNHRMKKSGVPAYRQNRLVNAELSQFPETAGQPGPGPHGMQGFHRAETRRQHGHGIAADIAAHEAVTPVQLSKRCESTRTRPDADNPGRRSRYAPGRRFLPVRRRFRCTIAVHAGNRFS